MKSPSRIHIYSLSLLILTIIMSFTIHKGVTNNGSTNKRGEQTVSVLIKGTSSLHDWEMKSEKGKVEVLLGMGNNAQLLGLSTLKFSIEAESLKSKKDMMDNNAYKALKTKSAKTIAFVLSSAKIKQLSETTYQIKAIGKLTVAGTTRETDISADVKYNASEKSYTVTGTKKLKMTDYDVKPPSFMMGTVKTGNEISISFKTKFAQ